MSNLDPRIEAVRAQYGLDARDFWQIPQNKQWVCKHAALEVVATKANVEWQQPQIIEADTSNGIAVLSVSGKLGERLEWATGEASPKNNKNSYPWAMAEKRAKDRVVLKLVGIHGLVYSEDEMPNGGGESQTITFNDKEPPTKSSAQLKREDAFAPFQRELDECQTLIALEKFKAAWRQKIVADGWTAAWKSAAKDRIEGREAAIMNEMERLSEASPEELAQLPVRDALEHSAFINPLAGG